MGADAARRRARRARAPAPRRTPRRSPGVVELREPLGADHLPDAAAGGRRRRRQRRRARARGAGDVPGAARTTGADSGPALGVRSRDRRHRVPALDARLAGRVGVRAGRGGRARRASDGRAASTGRPAPARDGRGSPPRRRPTTTSARRAPRPPRRSGPGRRQDSAAAPRSPAVLQMCVSQCARALIP